MPDDIRWDDWPGAERGWTRARNEPITRLYEDIFEQYYNALKKNYARCGCPISRNNELKIVHGYPYNRAPDEGHEEAMANLREYGARAAMYTEQGTTFYAEEVRDEVIDTIKRLRRHPKPTASHKTLLGHLARCVDAYAHIIGDLHWRMAGAAIAENMGSPNPGLRFDWPKRFQELTGEPESEATTLLSGTANELTTVIKKMRKLAGIANSDPDLMKAVGSQDVDALAAGEGPAFDAFNRGFKSLLANYGQRIGVGYGSNTSPSSPTWNVRPQIPLQMIGTYARSDLDAISVKEKEVAKDRRRLLSRIRKNLKDDPAKLAEFDKLLAQGMRQARFMEEHNHWMDQSAPGVAREAAHVFGQRLVKDGAIDDADDVLYLGIVELRDYTVGKGPRDLREIVNARKEEFESRKQLDAPETIGEVPEFKPPFAMWDEGEGLQDQTLRGIAASGGKFTGRARVILPHPGPPDVEEGDVLVAVDAGPDWTPVFAILGAVVLDRGSAFQHAALMAREFGIPAVTGTKEGTSAIKDGQTVTVDGGEGTVQIAPDPPHQTFA